jgi:PIN domain nuclease of toxin-antitoxin system
MSERLVDDKRKPRFTLCAAVWEIGIGIGLSRLEYMLPLQRYLQRPLEPFPLSVFA